MDRLDLFLLYHRRLQGDLIEVYKITRNVDSTENLYPETTESRIKTHIFKLKVKIHFFAQLVVVLWNKLPGDDRGRYNCDV